MLDILKMLMQIFPDYCSKISRLGKPVKIMTESTHLALQMEVVVQKLPHLFICVFLQDQTSYGLVKSSTLVCTSAFKQI